MYSMLQGGARMIGQGGGPHPQALGPPGGPQFPSQGDAPQGPQQGIYGKPKTSSAVSPSYCYHLTAPVSFLSTEQAKHRPVNVSYN